MRRILLLFSLAALPAAVAQPKPILTCPMVDRTKVILLGESHGLEGWSLLIQVDGKTAPALQFMSDTEFVGEVVLAKCLHKTMVFAIEDGSPYLKGVVLRKNPVSHAVERIYFAEKALPQWLYTSDEEMLVVIPNIGLETSRKYLVYRYDVGRGQPMESTADDSLPSVTKHAVTRIR